MSISKNTQYQKLKRQSPPKWADTVAARLNISRPYVYASGRGIRKERHIDVLTEMKNLINEYENNRKKIAS